jgi:hypothetical protein
MSFAENNSIFAILPKSPSFEMRELQRVKKNLPSKMGDS